MPKLTPRSDQVGSQLRPPELAAARDKFKRHEITRDQLHEAEDAAILESLGRQRDIGLDVLSDGEFRRDAWLSGISDALDGFAADYPVRPRGMPDGSVVQLVSHAKPVVGKLRPKRRIAEHEAGFLAAHARQTFKITLPSPNRVGRQLSGEAAELYRSRDEVLADLIPVYQAEFRALADEGVPYIQLDETIQRFTTAEARQELSRSGESAAAVIAREVAADNACFSAVRDSGVITAKHFCRGSHTQQRGNGDYEWIAEHVFPELKADRLLLEYDSDLVGGFEPLRFVPKGTVVVLGLVTSKYPALEDPDWLIRKVEEAARFCPVEQLALSPQCGFGGAADNSFMSLDEQWRKLENMVQTAHRIW